MPAVRGCPSVAVLKAFGLFAENLEPDLAGPHPIRFAAQMHLQNQRANSAITGLFRQAGGGHNVENRSCQAGKVIPNSPAEMSVELPGCQVFESCCLVLVEAAASIIERRINRPGPRMRWRF